VKVDRIIKKLRKAADKIPDMHRCLVRMNTYSAEWTVSAKNKVAFRFIRDQLECQAAKDVNHCYGIGGSMSILQTDTQLIFVLRNENRKEYRRVVLTCDQKSEEEVLDDSTNNLAPS